MCMVQLGERVISCLVDSGADVSVIRENLLEILPDSIVLKRDLQAGPSKCSSASGHNLGPRGQADLSFSIEGNPLKHTFCVAKNIHLDLILGSDFLNTNKVRFDFDNYPMNLGEGRSVVNLHPRGGVTTASPSEELVHWVADDSPPVPELSSDSEPESPTVPRKFDIGPYVEMLEIHCTKMSEYYIRPEITDYKTHPDLAVEPDPGLPAAPGEPGAGPGWTSGSTKPADSWQSMRPDTHQCEHEDVPGSPAYHMTCIVSEQRDMHSRGECG